MYVQIFIMSILLYFARHYITVQEKDKYRHSAYIQSFDSYMYFVLYCMYMYVSRNYQLEKFSSETLFLLKYTETLKIQLALKVVKVWVMVQSVDENLLIQVQSVVIFLHRDDYFVLKNLV